MWIIQGAGQVWDVDLSTSFSNKPPLPASSENSEDQNPDQEWLKQSHRVRAFIAAVLVLTDASLSTLHQVKAAIEGFLPFLKIVISYFQVMIHTHRP